MLFENLNDDNFVLYAAKSYDNINCTSYEEFLEDLSKIKYIKRLLKKYSEGEELNTRLILNHIIVFYNVFHHEAATRMLCFKCKDYLPYLKPFLVQMNYWPDLIDSVGIERQSIIGDEIMMDPEIVNELRKI